MEQNETIHENLIDEWDWVYAETVHILICGTTGSGKSSFAERLAQSCYRRGDKVIDAIDEGRLECGYWRFPEDRAELVRKIRAEGEEPTGFPLEVLMPRYLGQGTVEKVPDYFAPFTIPLSDLTVDDLRSLMRITSREWSFAVEMLLDRALNQCGPEDGIDKLIRNVLRQLKTGIIALEDVKVPLGDKRSVLPIVRRLHELRETGLISSGNDPLVLNFHRILANPETITSFTVFNVGALRVRYAVWAYILRKILDVKRKHFDLPRTLLYIREARLVAPAKTSLFTDVTQTRRNLSRIAREGRDAGIRLLMDTQRYLDVDLDIRSQADCMILLRLFFDDLAAACSSVYLSFDTMLKMQRLQRGKAMFLGRGMYRYPCTLQVSLSKHKAEGENLFQVCERYGLPVVPYLKDVRSLNAEFAEKFQDFKKLPERFSVRQFFALSGDLASGSGYRMLSNMVKTGLLSRIAKGSYQKTSELEKLLSQDRA